MLTAVSELLLTIAAELVRAELNAEHVMDFTFLPLSG